MHYISAIVPHNVRPPVLPLYLGEEQVHVNLNKDIQYHKTDRFAQEMDPRLGQPTPCTQTIQSQGEAKLNSMEQQASLIYRQPDICLFHDLFSSYHEPPAFLYLIKFLATNYTSPYCKLHSENYSRENVHLFSQAERLCFKQTAADLFFFLH